MTQSRVPRHTHYGKQKQQPRQRLFVASLARGGEENADIA